MTPDQRKSRFVERLQAVGCPVCRSMMELRRSTWDDPVRKIEALEAFQLKHSECQRTGVPPARPVALTVETIQPEERKERAWRAGMARHANELQAGVSGVRSAA